MRHLTNFVECRQSFQYNSIFCFSWRQNLTARQICDGMWQMSSHPHWKSSCSALNCRWFWCLVKVVTALYKCRHTSLQFFSFCLNLTAIMTAFHVSGGASKMLSTTTSYFHYISTYFVLLFLSLLLNHLNLH